MKLLIKRSLYFSLFLLLFSFLNNNVLISQNLTVSGITNPAAANGTYIKQVSQIYTYDYWIHSSGSYYIYNDNYAGRYWNIDDNTDDEDDVLLFYYESDVTSPAGLSPWTGLGTAATPSPTGSPAVTEQASASAPTVTTNSASSISTYGATLNGTVNANNASTTVTFEYGLNTSYGISVTADQSPVTGSTNTSVSKSISSLSPNTTYHYRVVGVNSEGTTYGADETFTTDPKPPTVTTQAVSSISQTTATGNGNITDLGSPNPTQHGVCWNTGGTPTTTDDYTDEGAVGATGAFTCNITSLSPNTTYYVRAYARNTAGTTYGSQVAFTTDPEVPTVTTQAVTSISQTTATGNGNITDLGSPNPTQHGVCWNTGGTPTTTDDYTDEGAVGATGAFTCNITSLSPNTTYYVRAYATNTAGTTYGSQVAFTTDPEAPTVTTQAVTSISQTTATGNGNITDLGSPNPTQHGVCWNTGGTPTTTDDYTDEGAVGATEAFTCNITSLSSNTTYYVRAYARNTAGTTYGSQVSFMSTTTSLNHYEKTFVNIYPNPTVDVINIRIGYATDKSYNISITDICGKTIYKKNHLNQLCKIDVSGFKSGLYIIELKSKTINEKFKIFKN